ncbi:uncharacterized protein LOC115691407 [Syzygium oleosum]|uniref:uncharacterized protein LOC115691407 n=1 Tax=Syzygium oleosum TaxID=219896 RepID=UPI0024B9D828|nr:uncharacterized protein LOC115691407 [Syzygium oleosum]
MTEPSPVIEADPTPVTENLQAKDGFVANTITEEPKGKSTSFLIEAERPFGHRPILKGNSSRSRSRGRPKARSRSRRRTDNAGIAIRSESRANPVRKTTEAGQTSSRPQGHLIRTPATRTWANIAKVLTKGYDLAFVPPVEENGELIVDITPEVAADQNPFWLECIVGHYIGKKVPFKLTEEAFKKTWGEQVVDVKLHENGFYFFRVPNDDFRRKILEMGPVSIFSSTMLLQQWHPKLKLKKGAMDSLPVWVRLRDIPFSLWSPAGIGRIASAIGKPLYVDTQTEHMSRISYARVCVEIKATKPRLETVKVRWDGEVNLVHIEYEWKPLVCSSCGLFGHKAGSNGFDCASGHHEDRAEKTLRPQANARPETTLPPRETEGWTQVSRKKCKLLLSKGATQSSSASHLILEANPGGEDLLPSVRDPSSAHGLSRPDLNSPKVSNAGLTRTANDLLLDTTSKEDELLPPVVNPFTEHELISIDLNFLKESNTGMSHSAVPGPQGCIHQQIEDLVINSQSSSDDSSGSQVGVENSDSEELLVEDPAVISPPTTRSRTLATNTLEDTSKASRGPIPSMSCPVVYGEHSFVKRRPLWADLLRISACDLPWIVAGDFNAIKDPDDRVGSTTPWIPAFDEFGDCLNQTGLEDLQYVGCRYTWTHSSGANRKLRKIDRVLANDIWMQQFSFSEASFLSPGISDHSPMVIKILSPHSSKKPFKFFNFWTTHPKFLELVKQAWDTHIIGTPMYIICCKLRVLKLKLKLLNRSSFSDISTRTDQARSDLYAVQSALQLHPYDQSLLDREVEHTQSFSSLRMQEESFYRQKSRIRWLKEGDLNTKFFHHFVNKRRLHNRILSVSTEDGSIVTDPQAVRSHIVGHFQEILNGSSASVWPSVSEIGIYLGRALDET